MNRLILAIDGGGIRGLIPALLLSQIEDLHDVLIKDVFDLVVGTSTGGILACACACGIPAEEVADLYQVRGPKIFQRSRWNKFRNPRGLFKPRYTGKQLKIELDAVFGDTMLDDPEIGPMVITSYNMGTGDPEFYKTCSWRGTPRRRLLIKDVAYATSAAPTYFPPTKIGSQDDGGYMVDGGVHSNDPALCAWVEARKLWPDDGVVLVSMGTGRKGPGWKFIDPTGWGVIRWAVPALNIMMDGAVDVVDHYCQALLGDSYLRVDRPLDGVEMDDTSDSAMQKMESSAFMLAKSPAWDKVLTHITKRMEQRL